MEMNNQIRHVKFCCAYGKHHGVVCTRPFTPQYALAPLVPSQHNRSAAISL